MIFMQHLEDEAAELSAKLQLEGAPESRLRALFAGLSHQESLPFAQTSLGECAAFIRYTEAGSEQDWEALSPEEKAEYLLPDWEDVRGFLQGRTSWHEQLKAYGWDIVRQSSEVQMVLDKI